MTSILKCLHRFRVLLQSVILCLGISYYSYLRAASARTENWRSDVSYCFAQIGKCMSSNGEYGIATISDPSANFPPLCYSLENGDKNMCYSSSEALTCVNSKWRSHSSVNLEELFRPEHSQESYFHFDVVILALLVVVLVMSIIFSDSKNGFVSEEEGAFSSAMDGKTMSVLGVLLTFVISSLMFASSQMFLLLRVDSCGIEEKSDTRRHQNNWDEGMCDDCKTNIRSIVLPHNFLVKHYPAIAITFGILILTACAYNTIFSKTDEEEAEGAGDIFSFFSRHDSEDAMHAVRAARRYRTASHVSVNASIDNERRNSSAAEVYHNHSVFKKKNEGRMRNWKFGFEACGIDPSHYVGKSVEEDECAVCLEPLVCSSFEDKGSTVPVAPSATTGWSAWEALRQGASGGGQSVATERDLRGSGRSGSLPSSSSRRTSRSRLASVVPVNSQNNGGTGGALLVPVKLPCGHCFHERCICAWMRTESSCPICRADLETGAAPT